MQDVMEIENEIVEKGVWYFIQEEGRTYTMADGTCLTVLDGRRLRVSDRDTHYIEDRQGDLHIIRNTWNHIIITKMEDPR